MTDQDTSDAKEHLFWNTQPVPQKLNNAVEVIGPIDAHKSVEDIRKEPYPIASTFEWWVPNMNDENDLNLIYELLRDNYVEDTDSLFRFNYSTEFLKWALTPPNYVPEWHVSVRRKHDGKVLAFISAIPLTVAMGKPHASQKEQNEKENKEEEINDVVCVQEKTECKEMVEDCSKKEEIECEQEVSELAINSFDTNVDRYFNTPREICEINFLCVHKQLRDKRMAPILIKEVTRRVNLRNKWQAVYTSGTKLPTPFASARYFHWPANVEKLFDVRFFRLPKEYERFQDAVAMYKRAFTINHDRKMKSLREMTVDDVPQVHQLLSSYLDKFDVHPVFSQEEIEHNLLPRERVVYSYVIERKGKITDFFSFYLIPSTVIGHQKYNSLDCVYIYYYVATTISVEKLIQNLLIVVQEHGFDVCNVVEILDGSSFIAPLKFQPGDGFLNYYFYN